MKIASVNNNLNSGNISKIYSYNADNNFLYLQKQDTDKHQFREHKAEYISGLIAIGAALIALSRFIIKNSTPKEVVEIAKSEIGLNKSGIDKDFTRAIKDTILYPIMSVKNGHWRIVHSDRFSNGVLIAGENAKAHSEAFIEHAQALGIPCLKLNTNTKHKNKLISSAYKIIEEAIALVSKNSKDCVIIDVGDIENLVNLKKFKANREEISNIEKKLTSAPKRIIWSGWTNKPDDIPYYYYNTLTKIFVIPK